MRAALAILVLLSLAAAHPPLPKRPHKSAAVHQGAAAQKLLTKTPRAVVLQSVRLDWDYDGPREGIVFHVWQGPKWKLVATESINSCVLPFDSAASVVFLKVTASNTLTHLESL